jgi:hypothetical protein
MAARLSAVDSISPAIEVAKRQLFRPFRWGRWTRLALITLLSGEMSGSGGGFNFTWPHGTGRRSSEFLSLASPGVEKVLAWLPVILLVIVGVAALVLLWMYISSVFRFILLDSVLYDRCQIRAGWRRWQPQGISYFLWSICFVLVTVLGLGVLVGAPVALAWTQGAFREPRQHLVLLIVGGALLLILLFAYFVAAAVVGLFAKDFLVPMMALENLRVMAAWRRFIPLLKTDKGGYAIYVLMKVVLAMGVAILFGIIALLALLALLIPFGTLALALYLIWTGVGLHWNPATIGTAVLLGTLTLAIVVYVMGFVFTPATVFFQAYVLHFFAGRYPPLGNLMAPPPPAESAPPTPLPASAG